MTEAAEAPNAESDLFVGRDLPFSPGTLGVRSVDVAACDLGAPLPLRVHAPAVPGAYPLIVFQHGFLARYSAYDEILQHLASHGFVVVAPQMYELDAAALLGNPTAEREAAQAVAVLDWAQANVHTAVGYELRADRVGICGHSRGGKVSCLVASADPARISAVAGIDPVDGAGDPGGNGHRVTAEAFSFNVPALVIGAEIGGVCAPAGDNHEQFFAASQSPAWHIVALGHGHGDMLDERVVGVVRVICTSGPDRAGMRRLTAGLLVAFFRGALQEDAAAFEALSRPQDFPIAGTVQRK